MTKLESPADVRDFDADIGLMQTVYGILLVLGFRQLGDALYDLVSGGITDRELFSAFILGATALLLLGFRFFWAVGNIRRYAIRHEADPHTRRYVTTLHFPTLLIHAMGYYFLCRILADMNTRIAFHARAPWFVGVSALFLLVNVMWLLQLTRGLRDKHPEILWIKNNAFTGAAVCVAFWSANLALRDTCLPFLVVCVILIASSFIDLWRTAETYIARRAEERPIPARG